MMLKCPVFQLYTLPLSTERHSMQTDLLLTCPPSQTHTHAHLHTHAHTHAHAHAHTHRHRNRQTHTHSEDSRMHKLTVTHTLLTDTHNLICAEGVLNSFLSGGN